MRGSINKLLGEKSGEYYVGGNAICIFGSICDLIHEMDMFKCLLIAQ